MEFRILGQLEVIGPNGVASLGGRRQQALLALLIVSRNRPVSVSHLIDDLWGDEPPPSAEKTVQVYVSRLRGELGKARIETLGRAYLLRLDDSELDLGRFESLVERSGQEVPRAAGATLREALGLFRGEPFGDLAHELWALSEVARLEDMKIDALERRLDADLESGRHRQLVAELEALVREYPHRERMRGQLMVALYRSGRQADALEYYRQGRAILDEQLGLEPGPELRALEQRILRQDPALTVMTAVGPDPVPLEGKQGRGAGAFVGRDDELAGLLSALGDAKAGTGQLVVVTGEAGIGKSRMCEEFAHEAEARGASVLWGRCWEAGGAPAYWPWVQALRTHVRVASPGVLRSQLGGGVADLGQLLPELRDLYPDVPELGDTESEGARFRLFESMSSFLRNVAEVRPLLLLLDDLHVADPSSLLMLEFMASVIADTPMTLVAIFRTPLDPEVGVDEALFELSRKAGVRISLGGLSESDVASFIDSAAEVTAQPTVVEAIFRETEGNPLFVGEIVRLLVEEGRLDRRPDASWRLSIPQGVRKVIGRRLQLLSPECTEALVLASVLGREFRLDALERLCGRGPDELIELLDEAVAQRVVAGFDGLPPRLRFAHALIRDTLYDSLPPSRQIDLHRRAGAALEEVYAADLDPYLTELAHHYLAAAPGGDAAKAIDLARRAGDHASGLLAREEAARLYELALSALPLDPGSEVGLELELQLALGGARAGAGEMAEARVAFLRAAELARRQCDAERLARAALGYGGQMVWGRAGGDPIVVSLLEEAIAALGDAITPLRARLLARLAGALRDDDDPDRRESLGGLAVSIARKTGDPSAVVYALHGLLIGLQASPDPDRRLAIAAELSQLTQEVGDKEGEFDAGSAELMIYFELGRLDLVRERAAREQGLAEAMRLTPYLWAAAALQVMLALHDGRFAEAEVFLSRSRELGLRSQEAMAEAGYALQLYELRREQGRANEADGLLARAAVENPSRPLFSCALARLATDLGRQVEARTLFDRLAEEEFRAVPRDQEWLLAMSFLTDVCASLYDVERAAILYDHLLPYADRMAADVHEGSGGAVARSLGILASLLGRTPEAIHHLESAVQINVATGALPWAAHSRVELANVLISAGHHAPAYALLEEARNSARALGMRPLEERAAGMLTRTS